jgi:hypothetical protein
MKAQLNTQYVDYYALKGYYSSSEIKEYILDPLSWEEKYYHGKRFQTPAMEMGTLVHQAILEPDVFKNDTLYRPEGVKLNTKAGKEWKKDNSHKKVLDAKQEETINGILSSLERCYSGHRPFNDYKNILEFLRAKPKVEQEFVVDDFALTDDIHRPIKMKCDAYWMQDNVLHIIDVKTANEYFSRNPVSAIRSGRYDVQGAWYGTNMKRILGAENFIFSNLFIESVAPYKVKLVVYPTQLLTQTYSLCVDAIIRMERDRTLLKAGQLTSYRELPVVQLTDNQLAVWE